MFLFGYVIFGIPEYSPFSYVFSLNLLVLRPADHRTLTPKGMKQLGVTDMFQKCKDSSSSGDASLLRVGLFFEISTFFSRTLAAKLRFFLEAF